VAVPAPLGDRVSPIDRRGGMSIYYAAPPAPEPSDCTNKDLFCVVSMKDVINGAVSREQITGRAVFIGAHSLSGVPDSYPVPNSSGKKMFGVEIWANAAQSILTNRYPVLKQSDPVTLAQLLVVTLAGLLLVFRWRLYGFLGALGGEERRVTVVFGDIRGFTTISEGLAPEILLGHLNRYFDGMVDIVNRYEGTVNKFNGDNIMVLWGAPLEVKDQARKAVECAL